MVYKPFENSLIVSEAICKLFVNSIIWRKYQNWIALRQNKPYKHYFRKHK